MRQYSCIQLHGSLPGLMHRNAQCLGRDLCDMLQC
jgi:hypothetical protein